MVDAVNSEFTPDIVQVLGAQEEDYAAGILNMKKKFPALYKHFEEDWLDLFEDLTKNFNREMIRGLKKLGR